MSPAVVLPGRSLCAIRGARSTYSCSLLCPAYSCSLGPAYSCSHRVLQDLPTAAAEWVLPTAAAFSAAACAAFSPVTVTAAVGRAHARPSGAGRPGPSRPSTLGGQCLRGSDGAGGSEEPAGTDIDRETGCAAGEEDLSEALQWVSRRGRVARRRDMLLRHI